MEKITNITLALQIDTFSGVYNKHSQFACLAEAINFSSLVIGYILQVKQWLDSIRAIGSERPQIAWLDTWWGTTL